jgi:type VI secretion system protein ImpE
MDEAKALLDEGRLADAVEAVTREVRARPGDDARRMFLFELLLFAGEWERALKQLDAVARRDPQSEPGAQVLRNNIAAMRERERLFAEGVAPHFVSEPPADIDLQLAAVGEWRAGRAEDAARLLEEAAEARSPLTGRLAGHSFDDWRDADALVAPALELIISDKYTWLPFAQVRRVELAAPRRLRDLIWCPARVETRDGVVGELFVPALYEGSERAADESVRLGRVTEWREEGGVERAAGLRLFVAGDEEVSILEARQIEFD